VQNRGYLRERNKIELNNGEKGSKRAGRRRKPSDNPELIQLHINALDHHTSSEPKKGRGEKRAKEEEGKQQKDKGRSSEKTLIKEENEQVERCLPNGVIKELVKDRGRTR